MKLIIFIWLYYLYCKRIILLFNIFIHVIRKIHDKNSKFFVLSDVINCQCLLFNQILSHRYIKSLFVKQVIKGKKVELSIKFNKFIFLGKSSIFLW